MKQPDRSGLRVTAIWLCLLATGIARADGNSIDKVYHPYVYPTETEIEFRSVILRDPDPAIGHRSTHRLGYGKTLTETFFAEFYLIGKITPTDDFDLDAIEVEGKLQLTEQGEYAADWGLLFEFEKGFRNNLNELSTTLITEKEFGRTIGTLNLSFNYEWAFEDQRRNNSNDFEINLAAQLRYRYRRAFEPAVEYFRGQNTHAIGPVATGAIRMQRARKLHWEVGVLFGLLDDTPQRTYRLLLEYEF